MAAERKPPKTKPCEGCGVLMIARQRFQGGRRDGHHPLGRFCSRACERLAYSVKRAALNSAKIEQECDACHRVLPVVAFYLQNIKTGLRVKRCRACCAERNAPANKAWWASIRREFLAAYGGKCACCGEGTQEFLSLDHINGDGSQHRKMTGSLTYLWLRKRGWPKDNYRLLCMNCNFARGRYGYCPHENGD